MLAFVFGCSTSFASLPRAPRHEVRRRRYAIIRLKVPRDPVEQSLSSGGTPLVGDAAARAAVVGIVRERMLFKNFRNRLGRK